MERFKKRGSAPRRQSIALQALGDQSSQAKAPLLGHGGGKLLFGKIRGAVACGVLATREPVAAAFADGMQHLAQQQSFKLLGGIVDSCRVVGFVPGAGR